MAQIEFNETENALINQNTYIAPTEEESTQSDFSALGEVFNSTAALYQRGAFENAAYDTSKFEGVEFNREALVTDIKGRDVSPDVMEQLLSSHLTSWKDLEARTAWLQHHEKTNQQVQENFSTAGMLALGIPMAVVDPTDLFSVAPVLKIGSMVKKGMNLSNRLGKGIVNASEGAIIGATTMGTYEAATGVYKDDSLIEAATVGALVGGSLGFFVDKAAQQKSLLKTVDEEGNVVNAAESKQAQKAAAEQELKDVEDVINEVKVAKANKTNLSTAEKASEATDKAVATNQAKVNLEKLRAEATKTGALKKENAAVIKVTKDVEESLGKKGSAAERAILKSERGAIKLKAAVAEIKVTTKLVSNVRGQITKLTKQLDSIKKQRTKESAINRKELRAKLTKLQDSLEKKSGRGTRGLLQKLIRLEKVRSANLVNTPVFLKALQKEAKEAREQQGKAGATLKAQRKAQATYAAQNKAAREARDNFSLTKQIGDGTHPSALTDKLKGKLEKLNSTLSPQGVKSLLERKGLLTSDLAKISDDDFNLSTLRGVKQSKQNYVDKLSKELDLFDNLKDFRQSPEFKKLSPEMRKWTISPVEKLLNDDNDFVSGLASMLHSGTLHHGKINNMTAWVLRGMLDNQLERMHKSITNSWQLARKEGYTGKLDEFEADILLNAHRVNGQMRRDIFTGMDGSIVGRDRFEVAKGRIGSVTRKHNSDNKWVVKGTDDLLDYYESIHAHGSKLGMESFSGSLSKGYINRVYSSKAIGKMGSENAIQLLTDAQISFARATNSELTPTTIEEFRQSAKKAVEGSLDKSARKARVTRELGVPRQSSTSSVKQRSIDVFDDDIAELMDDNLRGITQLYGLSLHGRLALKERLGVDSDTQLTQMIKATGATQKQTDDFNVLVETIKGSREISNDPMNPFTRVVKAASSYSSIMHTMAFAIPTISEVASIAKEFGWGKTMSALAEDPAEIYRMYRFGTPSEKNTVEMMISYGDAHFSAKANRMEADNFDSAGKFQEFMDDVVRRESVYSGLMPLTDMLRMTTATLSVDFMAGLSIANKVSKADLKRLNDMGFGLEDLTLIRETLQVDKAGRIGNPDRKTWGELDRKITAGVMTMVERTILNPNGATLPKFMTDVNTGQVLPRIMFKFMRFPFESYERMLGRGMQEADAKQAAGFAGNIAIWSVLLAAKDAIKAPEDQMYSEENGFNDLMLDSFKYNSFTSLPLAMLDTSAGLLTGENLTNDYRYRALGVVQSDYESAQKGDFRYSIPLSSVNIGDAAGSAFTTLFNLEEVNKDD